MVVISPKLLGEFLGELLLLQEAEFVGALVVISPKLLGELLGEELLLQEARPTHGGKEFVTSNEYFP